MQCSCRTRALIVGRLRPEERQNCHSATEWKHIDPCAHIVELGASVFRSSKRMCPSSPNDGRWLHASFDQGWQCAARAFRAVYRVVGSRVLQAAFPACAVRGRSRSGGASRPCTMSMRSRMACCSVISVLPDCEQELRPGVAAALDDAQDVAALAGRDQSRPLCASDLRRRRGVRHDSDRRGCHGIATRCARAPAQQGHCHGGADDLPRIGLLPSGAVVNAWSCRGPSPGCAVPHRSPAPGNGAASLPFTHELVMPGWGTGHPRLIQSAAQP